jgi:filamentous hemagglutinin family protein
MCSETSLNHTFRTVWNSALGAMVAVPESASGHSGGNCTRTKGSKSVQGLPNALAVCVALAWGGMAGNAMANPEGGVVIAGQASMVTNGNQLLVTTQNAVGTNHSAINWQSFSIPAGSSTYFQQPSAASTVINQVVTSTPSLIFGTLGSNGNLVLVNQSGITVGAGAVVDTAGFTASALRMRDADARAGVLNFGDGNAADGTVSVQGSVLARSGDVVLIAAHVETGKDALIQAPNGSTLLAAGQRIGITGRGLEGISLEVQAPADSAVNLGTLQGDAVGIFASTLKHSGTIQANAVSTEGGKVVLTGLSALDLDGTVQSSALGQRGGTILASAQHVILGSAALLDASGALGGGEVLVGGGYQGHDARVVNAQTTQVASGAQLRANAVTQGNGGTVVVWADGATRFAGAISAQGGSAGGNGGTAEVSGKQYLDFQGLVDLRAAQGQKGSLLLDPTNIVIGTCANISGGTCGYGSDIVSGLDLSNSADYGSVTSYITAGAIGTLLNTADVTLAATNDITVSTAISKTGSTATSLTMNAGNDIVFGSGVGISSSSGVLNVGLTAGNAISTSGGSTTLQTQGGNVTLKAGTGGVAPGGYGAKVTLDTSSATAKGGNVSVQSGGAVSLGEIQAYGANGGGSVSVSTSQDLTLNGSMSTTSSVNLSATGNLNGNSYSVGDESNSASSISITSGGTSGSLPSFYTNGSVSVTMTGTGSYVFDGYQFGNASTISLATPNGNISASQNFNSVAQLTATAANGIDITNSSISAFQATNTGSGNINFTNSAAVTISGLSAANGNITVDNTGGITTTGAVKAPNGSVSITAHSPITIGTGGVTAGSTITLSAPTAGVTSNITLNGTIQSTGGSISMSAANNLVQNSGVIAAGGITASATGTMSFGPNGYSSGSPLNYSDASGSISPPLVPLSALVTSGGSVSDFLDQFLAALDNQNTFTDDPFDPRNRRIAGLVVEGQLCTP